MARTALGMWMADVWNCAHAFEVVCPQTWDELTPTGDPTARHCRACDRIVHLCPTPEEFAARGEAGQCVAIPHGMRPFTIALGGFLGQPSADAVQELAERKAAVRRWWQSVIDLAPGFAAAEMPDLRRVFVPPPAD